MNVEHTETVETFTDWLTALSAQTHADVEMQSGFVETREGFTAGPGAV